MVYTAFIPTTEKFDFLRFSFLIEWFQNIWEKVKKIVFHRENGKLKFPVQQIIGDGDEHISFFPQTCQSSNGFLGGQGRLIFGFR